MLLSRLLGVPLRSPSAPSLVSILPSASSFWLSVHIVIMCLPHSFPVGYLAHHPLCLVPSTYIYTRHALHPLVASPPSTIYLPPFILPSRSGLVLRSELVVQYMVIIACCVFVPKTTLFTRNVMTYYTPYRSEEEYSAAKARST